MSLNSTKLIPCMCILCVEQGVKTVDFGKKLKELRIDAGLTQSQLGSLIGVTKSVISFYELQERTPSPDVLIKLAGVFHVTTDYLLGLDIAETLDISDLDREDIILLRAMADRLRHHKSKKSC